MQQKLLTEPQEEVTLLVLIAFPDSDSNSSAKPHEQSLQALRFPVVPHTV